MYHIRKHNWKNVKAFKFPLPNIAKLKLDFTE